MSNKAFWNKAMGIAAACAFALAGGCGGSGDAAADAPADTSASTEAAAAAQAGAETEEVAAETESVDVAAETEAAKVAGGDAEDDLIPVRIGAGDVSTLMLNDLAQYAQATGLIDEELNAVGYKLEVSGFQGQGPEINAALMSGELDGASYGDLPAFTSKGSGANTTVVAMLNPQFSYGILAMGDDIQEPKDLEGKKIVVQQGTTLQYAWEDYAEGFGIDTSTVEIINSNVVDGLSLLQTGDADAVISQYASNAYYESQGVGHVIETEDFSNGASAVVLVFDNKFIEENHEAVIAFEKALIRASRMAQEDPQSFYDTLGERWGEVGSAVIEKSYGFDPTLSYLTPEITDSARDYLNNLKDWLNDNSLLQSDVDVDDFFDNSYYEEALAELGE